MYIIHTIKLHITYIYTYTNAYIHTKHTKINYILYIYTYTYILIPKITYYMYTNLHIYKQYIYVLHIYTRTHTVTHSIQNNLKYTCLLEIEGPKNKENNKT